MTNPATVTALVGSALFLVGSLATPGTAQLAEPGMPDLPGGLAATPGCLGIELARTQSGKSVIFAWFEDKKAVLRWFYSETHQQAMSQFFPDQEYHKPLEGIPDDIGPILAVASITMSDKQHFEETNLPISQIAIELYQPVNGGLFLGGRFAPETLTVERMTDYTPGRPATDLSQE